MRSIFKTVSEKVKKADKKRIGITLFSVDTEILNSLKQVEKYIDVVVVGAKIKGFESHNSNEKEAGLKLLQLWQDGEVDQVVRGQVDDLEMVEDFKKWKGVEPMEKRIDLALMGDAKGREFFITAASNPDARNYKDKERLTMGCIEFIKTYFPQQDIRVAVMTTVRPQSYSRDSEMTKTYDEAEKLVEQLEKDKIEARNVNIEIEKAAGWATLIVPARGTIGNQIFRTLLYLGDGKNYFTPTYFPGRGVYEDNSRNERDWSSHLIFAAYLALKEQSQNL